MNCGVIHWKDWCWSWSSNTLATWCEELTLWKRPCCWARLKVGGEGDDRGWDGLMASLSLWWHHKLMASHELAQTHGHEFEQALEVGGGQGSLVCSSPCGCKELDMTKQLNWNLTELGCSYFRLLLIVLLWKFIYKFLFDHMFPNLLCICPEVKCWI